MMSLFLYRFPFTLLFLFPFPFLFRIPVSGFSRRPLTGTYLCFYVLLADLSSVRYKTSTWNEIKELIKSNYVIIPSLLNKSPKNMTWNDRWETKLFLGGQGTARWNGSEINNLTCNPVQSSWLYLTFHPTLNRKLFLFSFSFLRLFCSSPSIVS